MSYIFRDTIWPEHHIPTATKELIAKLLELGDRNDPDVGFRMANEIFTPDGVLDHGAYKFEGREAISKCRSKPKPGSPIIKRHHHISRVYSQTEKADDLVVVGELVVEFTNGKVVHNILASRAVIDNSKPEDGPHLKLWAVYIDSAPMAMAAQE